MAHEDPITPGRASGLHVAARPPLVLLKGVARWEGDGELKKVVAERVQLFIELPELKVKFKMSSHVI